MKQVIQNYTPLINFKNTELTPMGDSVSPKGMVFNILDNNSKDIEILDIGFGTGTLGQAIKSNPDTEHWHVDGIDGWEINCHNKALFDKNIYRNVWHGLAQELPSDKISSYNIICILDVIEHLSAETAKWLLRTLLSSMGNESYLFVSTPLWFMPQQQIQDGDLEEHHFGVPASSMLALIPVMYAINEPLVGGFVYSKKSLEYIEMFQPCSNKDFNYEMGLRILRCMNIQHIPNTLYKTNIF